MCHAEVTRLLTTLAQERGDLAGIFTGVARTAFEAQPTWFDALLRVKLLGQYSFAHACGQQAPLTARENQVQLRELSQPSHRSRHALSCFPQRHLAMGSVNAGVLGGATKHDDARMANDHLGAGHRVLVF